MRVLVDTNIILDVFLDREPFLEEAEALFEAIVSGKLRGYVSASSVTDIFYLTQRYTRSIERARQAIAMILGLFQVCSVDYRILSSAYNSGLPDFEDAVQIACAVEQELDAIVTRNAQDFLTAEIQILDVGQVLEWIK